MPAPKRSRREPDDNWEQLRLFATWPEQEAYELLRPIVLFGQTAGVRATVTGVSARTLGRKADRFDAAGMASLSDDAQQHAGVQDRRSLPADIRRRIPSLKAEYPAFRPQEIAEICRRRDDCRASHKTVQRVLASHPLPVAARRRYPPYAQTHDGAERRLAIVHRYFDGWNIASIAGHLQATRRRVDETLHRSFTEGFAGMPDKAHTPTEPARRVDFKARAAIRRPQASADLGEFRIHAALAQLGIDLSPRTCGRIMAHNRQRSLPRPADSLPHEPKPMPDAATYRHEYWSVDVRYIEDHQLEQRKPVYVISILENYSRALLASVLSPRRDLTAFLIVLRAALHEHGRPTAIVGDGGSIFKASVVLKIYKESGIERCRIDAGRPWQNDIETHFTIMRRMLDYPLAQAQNWAAMRAAHDRFFADYNAQEHFAHRPRRDGRRSPHEVLGWVHGVWCDDTELDRLLRLRADRVFDQSGYLRHKRWRISGERGLAGRHGGVWLFGEVLTVTYEEDSLPQCRVAYEPDERHIQALTEPRLYPNRFRSPQRCLWDEPEVEWHLVERLPSYQTRHRPRSMGMQQRLFP